MADFEPKFVATWLLKTSLLIRSRDGQARDVTINGRSAQDLTLKGTTENQRLNITLVRHSGRAARCRGPDKFGDEFLASNVETTFTNADLTQLFQLAMPRAGVRISGRANGTIAASGNLLDEDKTFHSPACQAPRNFRS